MMRQIPGWLDSFRNTIYYRLPVADSSKFNEDFYNAITPSSDYPAIYRKVAVRIFEEYILPIADDENVRRTLLRTITGLKDPRTGSAERVRSSLALCKAYEVAVSAGVEVDRNECLYVEAMSAANASISGIHSSNNYISELFVGAEEYRTIPDDETSVEAEASFDAFYVGGAKLLLSCINS